MSSKARVLLVKRLPDSTKIFLTPNKFKSRKVLLIRLIETWLMPKVKPQLLDVNADVKLLIKYLIKASLFSAQHLEGHRLSGLIALICDLGIDFLLSLLWANPSGLWFSNTGPVWVCNVHFLHAGVAGVAGGAGSAGGTFTGTGAFARRTTYTHWYSYTLTHSHTLV